MGRINASIEEQTELNAFRLTERAIINVLDITDEKKNTYPKLDPLDEGILSMQEELIRNTKDILCTPHVRTKEDGSWFVDLYFSYQKNMKAGEDTPYEDDICTERLIIAPGYRMAEKDEIFLENIYRKKSHVIYSESAASFFENDINDVAPELHLQHYEDFLDAIKHVYYASHKSGVLELLYKSNLAVIAKHLEKFSDYNILACNLEEAFSLPVNLLRKLNHDEAIEHLLLDKETRIMTGQVYKNYHGELGKYEKINSYQIRYLFSLMEKNKPLDSVVLKALSTIEEGYDEDMDEMIYAEEVYQEYMNYISRLNLIGRNRKLFPKYLDLSMQNKRGFYYSRRLLEQCFENISYFERFHKIYEEDDSIYAYEDDKYKIIVPKTFVDLLEEGEQQHNCLQAIIEDDVLDGDSIILFMRDKNCLHKSLVTMEIRGNVITQARKKFNKDCSQEEIEFILNYANDKNLKVSIFSESLQQQWDRLLLQNVFTEMNRDIYLPADEQIGMGFFRIPAGIDDDVPFT